MPENFLFFFAVFFDTSEGLSAQDLSFARGPVVMVDTLPVPSLASRWPCPTRSATELAGDLAPLPPESARGVVDVTGHANVHAERVAGQVGERQVLDLDRPESCRGRRRLRSRVRSRARVASAIAARGPRPVKIWSTSPLTWAIAAPTALATAACWTRTTSLTPSRPSGIRNAPPPTAISGTARRRSSCGPMASSSIACIAGEARPRPGRPAGPRPGAGSPNAAMPAATAMSVAVSSPPPNTRASRVSR